MICILCGRMMTLKFECVSEFIRDIKKLRLGTIAQDLEVLKKAISSEPNSLSGTVRVSGLGNDVKIPIYKVRKFRCREIRNKGARSGIRVIYAYIIELDKIIFLEIYKKGKKTNHNIKRIIDYFKGKEASEFESISFENI